MRSSYQAYNLYLAQKKMQYLAVGSGTLVIFLLALIGGKKHKGLPDYIMIVWLFLFLANIATIFIIHQYGIPSHLFIQLLFEFSEASIFLHGPVFWFYTLSLTQISFRFRKKDPIHLLPFIIGFSILLEGVFSNGVHDAVRNVLLAFKMLSFLVYTLYVIVRLRKHRINVEKIFSNTEEKYLDWILFLAIGILIIWSIGCVSMVLFRANIASIPDYGGFFLNIVFTVFIFVMGYFGFYQSNVFLSTGAGNYPRQEIIALIDENGPGMKIDTSDKYKKSGLTAGKARNLHGLLQERLNREKSYLKKDLTLFSLAEELNTQPNHLSQVINMFEEKNFFDFINAFRVEEVKTYLLKNPDSRLTLLGVAYDCGFNSKSSFNRAFKKLTGLTPSEFYKSAKSN